MVLLPAAPADRRVVDPRARQRRRLGAQTTFFRLGDDPGLARFINQMAERVEGRVVSPELDDLGAAVVGSYLGSRGGRGGSGHMCDWYGGRGFWFNDD